MNASTRFGLRRVALAAQTALAALALAPAYAADDGIDPAIAALVKPASSLEIGVGNVSKPSFKANEYSGLKSEGAYGIFNIDLRGGTPYNAESGVRWRIYGTDLGTDARALGLEVWQAGGLSLKLGFDELTRLRSDSYQTPLIGAGGSTLTLPSTWQIPLVPRVSSTAANARGLLGDVTASSALVNGVLAAPTAAQLASAAAIQSADLPLFQHVDLYTRRKAYTSSGVLPLTDRLELTGSVRLEDKQGLKPMGTVTRATGGDISTVIPDLISQHTQQVNLALAYRGRQWALQGGYYGASFTNDVPSMTWSNWALPGNAQTMSSAPSNHYHQFNLTGSYAFTPSTKLTASGTWGRASQNDTLLTAVYTPMVPVTSIHGRVVSTAYSAKLNSRWSKDLNFNAAYKFDERDNRTPVNVFGFYDAGESAGTGKSVFSAYFPTYTLASNANINANRPYSKRVHQLDADVDYRVAKGESIKLALQSQQTDRYCNGSWIACADAARTKENTVKLDWRATAWETVQARLGYAHGARTVNYNEDAWLAIVPAANLSPTGAPGGSTAYGTMLALGVTGYGPVLGLNPLPTAGSAAAFFFANNNALSNSLYANANRISELPGMRRYNMADRTRDKVRGALDWQATEALSLQASLDFNNDNYSHSVYGLQKARSWAFNLDGTLALGEDTDFTAYLSHEDQRGRSAGNSYTANSTAANVGGFTAITGGCFATIALRNASNKVDPCLNWTADMRDQVDTLGFAFTQKGLLQHKLELRAGLNYTRARSTNDVAGGSYANNPFAVTGAPAGTVAALFINATPLPLVSTRTAELKLDARYAYSESTQIRIGYAYQRLRSTDWAYDGMQLGGLAGVLPSMETAPNYKQQLLGVSLIYSIR
jgi:MtrB/PioB family decaheme-associated outer membrane protein